MEVYRAVPISPSSFNPHYSTAESEPFDKLAQDFEDKLGVSVAGPDGSEDPSTASAEEKPQLEEEEEDDGGDGDSDFEFACLNPDGSPVSADDVFDNGRIRPFFPLFNRDLVFAAAAAAEPEPSSSLLLPPVKKVFAEAVADEPRGTYCDWRARIVEETPPSPGSCRKSNSTGSSKMWRFRDLLPRSNSDGRDAVVMLKPSDGGVEKGRRSTDKAAERKEGAKAEEAKKGKGKGKATAAAPSAHERHYVKSRAVKESEKRKSYLPYKRDLLGLGFFTSVNGLSKNLHPF